MLFETDQRPQSAGSVMMNPSEMEILLPRRWPWWRHILLHLAIWGSIGLLFAVQLKAARVADWDVAFRIATVDWAPWVVIGPLVFWFGSRLQFSRPHWLLPALIHLTMCIGIAATLEFITTMALESNWVRFSRIRLGPPPGEGGPPPPEGDLRFANPPDDGPGGPPPPEMRPVPRNRPFIFRAGRARVAVPIYCVLIASAHAFGYHRRALDRERRALQAEARLVEARLAALQSQLNPHFLFNTLNAIVHYVRADPDAAEEMITVLSELLRAVLAHAERREVPLEQELALVDHYLAIQRVRFADRLTVKQEIEPAALPISVPTLILQPLVENAVIHGIAPERTPGTLYLRAHIVDGRLLLEVADTGKGGPAAARPHQGPLTFREGVGLSNTRARLNALYGTNFHFQIAHAVEGGVSIRVSIPLRQPT